MTKEEFVNTLGAKLTEELSTAEVLSQVQYYRGYIDGEMSRGRSEEEVTDELGDPLLIAKTILEAPSEQDTIFGRIVPDEESSYEEGALAGSFEAGVSAQPEENRPDEAEAVPPYAEPAEENTSDTDAAAVEGSADRGSESLPEEPDTAKEQNISSSDEQGEDMPAVQEELPPESTSEAVKRQMAAARESTAHKYEEAVARAEMHRMEREEREAAARAAGEAGSDAAGGFSDDAEHVDASVEQPGSIFRDGNGDFNWGLLAVILAAVMIVVAICWIITHVVKLLGPALFIMIVIAVILLTMKSGRNKG